MFDPLSFVLGALFGAALAWGLVWRSLRRVNRRQRKTPGLYLGDVW